MIGQEALSGRMTGLRGMMTSLSGRMTGLSRRIEVFAMMCINRKQS